MTERESLLRGIARDPDDEFRVRVYSDWLKECGDEQDQRRADFIDRCVGRGPLPVLHDEIRDEASTWMGRWMLRETPPGTTPQVCRATNGMASGVRVSGWLECMNVFPVLLTQPVTLFDVVGVKPWKSESGRGYWFRQGDLKSPRGPNLPDNIWRRLASFESSAAKPDQRHYDSPAKALDALSAAVVDWGEEYLRGRGHDV